MSDAPKRTIIPHKKVNVLLTPGVEGLLGNALRLIELQLVAFAHKVDKGQSLNSDEARILQGYIRSLVELSKESREREKNDTEDLSKMTDEQLLALVEQLIAARGTKIAQTTTAPTLAKPQE